MSDRLTPETHAAYKYWPCENVELVDADFARKLERERHEARSALRTLADHGESEIQRLTKERDEARELCHELAGLVAYGLGQSGEEWSLDAMRQARDAIQKAKQIVAL